MAETAAGPKTNCGIDVTKQGPGTGARRCVCKLRTFSATMECCTRDKAGGRVSLQTLIRMSEDRAGGRFRMFWMVSQSQTDIAFGLWDP